MSTFLRKFAASRQQVRFLPRFSQSWPDTNHSIIQNNSIPKENRLEEAVSPIQNVKPTNKLKSPEKPATVISKGLVGKQPASTAKPQQSVTSKLKQFSDENINTTLDNEGNLLYIKMQNNDPRINKIMANIKSQKKNKDFILLEGKRLIKEALEAKCKLEYILFSRMPEVEYLKPYLPKAGKLYKMPYKEMQLWSDLTTTPGIMGIFKTPSIESFTPKEAIPLIIICDNIREPSNLGAILRVTSGVGCEQVILTKGCVNVWESKVLRSACGAHFTTKLSKDCTWDDIKTILPKKVNMFIADNTTITTIDQNNANSLNSVITNIPVLPYFSANFKSSNNHLVLIIGGETEGLSAESYQLAKELNGARLNVPLSNGVESLNTSTALGIIAFEIKRQLLNIELPQKKKLQKC